MGFYIRKSLRAGPLRFNLSKSGIGVSAGITGFRVGTGPRGNYVHVGQGGLYYKKTIPSGSKSVKRENLQRGLSSISMRGIESADTLELQDSSSKDLLQEINSKHKKLTIFPFLLIFLLFLWLYLISTPIPGLIDRGGLNLLLVNFGVPLMLLITVGALFLAYRYDQLSKTVILFYKLEEDGERAYQALHDEFQELSKCSRIWHIRAKGEITNLYEWKTNAGVDALIDRNRIRITFKSPPYISTNVAIPAIMAVGKTLYFLPDRILVYRQGNVGAVSYANVEISTGNTRMVESQGVPSDTTIIDHTWQFVNKDGGPDRRFNNNRQLPIVVYSGLYFTSNTGLNELIHLSKPDSGINLPETLAKLATVANTKQKKQLSASEMLHQATQDVKSGNKKSAFRLLVQVIKINPTDNNAEKAWLWMSEIVKDPQHKRKCFESILKINPNNTIARKALLRMNPSS